MSAPRIAIPIETQAKQRRASDPGISAWVSANAGSGKTFVLTRRVVRLLLAGAAPSRILCLTFTKAAAANMAVRVFETLAGWVTLDDATLAKEVEETGAEAPGPAQIAAARRLFARTVETPGGLKILTIHAFCEKLLHLFPFEANVPAGFSVIEDDRQTDLLARAREAVLAEAVADPASAIAGALALLSDGLSADAFETLVREVAGHRSALRAVLTLPDGIARIEARLVTLLGTEGQSAAVIERSMLEDGLPRSEWDAIGRHLLHLARGKNAAAEALIAAAAVPEAGRLDAYLAVFLTQKLTPRADSYLPKPMRAAEPALCGRLDAERGRLVALLARRRAAEVQGRTMALLTLAGRVLDRYDLLKRRAGLLDFGDLIERSRELLTRSDSAWVLYKLDAGISHILVDEAQDTSPDQWAILEAISRDFFAGAGAATEDRTFFAVGDEKQSIYSFQGARPAMMKTVRDGLMARATGAERPFESVDLLLSFRSVKTVLDVVDRVFAHPANAGGLTASGEAPPPHEALKAGLPGHVEIWPALGPLAVPDPGDWRLPLDVAAASDPPVVVAGRIADEIRRLTTRGSGETVDEKGVRRPVGPGDVLVLVRSRNAFFEAMIRALKERGVPVAGADRLNLTGHIATMDLVAAGRAALLPQDDLTLACVLKSPLLGFDDDDLIRLAPGRGDATLESVLRASPLPRDQVAAQTLSVWRARAEILTPFAFYTRLLGEDGGRQLLLGRLGPESADVIDEFLNLTLAHERDGAPSLLAFIAQLETADVSIKRDLEAAGGAVRVMTVHAAKGLEAKIVFLPDTCGAPSGRHDARLFRLDDGSGEPVIAWSGRADDDPAAVAAVRAAEREAALDEHRRLLYVALTRAEERLYIAGYHGKTAPPDTCWHAMINAVDLGLDTVPAPWDPAETIQRRRDEAPSAASPPAPAELPAPRVVRPKWLSRPAKPERPVAPPIRPSSALGAADRPDRDDGGEAAPTGARRAAALAGRLTHRLLQHLPGVPRDRARDAALRFLARHGRALPEAAREALAGSVLGVIDSPDLGLLFGPGSRAEVPVAATIPRPGAVPLIVTGQIDRLAETPTHIILADYKTGRPPSPGAPPSPHHLSQLALYAAAIAPLFPGKPVRACLIWTSGPVIVPVGEAVLRETLAAFPAG